MALEWDPFFSWRPELVMQKYIIVDNRVNSTQLGIKQLEENAALIG